MSDYLEDDRWFTAYDAELERQAEQREAEELAHRDRMIDKGDWPHPTFRCSGVCECGGQCERCAA